MKRRDAYADLIDRKGSSQAFDGIECGDLPADLFPHQRDLVRWSLRKGRAAIFADTGLGKTRMELEWARVVSSRGRVLILAPLAVAQQTVREGVTWGVPCAYLRDDDGTTPIVVANYEMLDHFDASRFVGVVLDESSILKAYTGATRNAIIGAFAATPYRLAATATPAPNDFTELGNHSEFLGVKSRVEMLAEYFAHDGGSTQDWRIKGHAVAHFWRWVATWGAVVRMPSDLGHDDGAYRLPPLRMHESVIDVDNDHRKTGMLFATDAATLQDQREVRRRTLADRVDAARRIASDSNRTKLATNVEEGIRGSQANAWEESSEAINRTGDGGTAGLHEEVLQGASREISSDSRATGETQRAQKGAVRGERGRKRGRKGSSEVLVHGESNEAQGTEDSSVRSDVGAIRIPAEEAGDGMRDLRSFGHVRSEPFSADRSLPHHTGGPRDLVRQVQQGDRAVLGQPSATHGSGGLPLLIWCELNQEQDALEKAFGHYAFSVRGSDSADDKAARVLAWCSGERPIMLSKPSVIGFGMNFQHCARMIFIGASHSYEQTYQAIRRCWRFGQTRPVDVHVIRASTEGLVVENYRRKEADAARMGAEMASHVIESVRAEVCGASKREWNPYEPAVKMRVPAWAGVEAT